MEDDRREPTVRHNATESRWSPWRPGGFCLLRRRRHFSNSLFTHHRPFSYILAGQPLKTHYEYLSQVIFYLLYNFGGPTGFIVFRMASAVAVGSLLLGIDKKNVRLRRKSWPRRGDSSDDDLKPKWKWRRAGPCDCGGQRPGAPARRHPLN